MFILSCEAISIQGEGIVLDVISPEAFAVTLVESGIFVILSSRAFWCGIAMKTAAFACIVVALASRADGFVGESCPWCRFQSTPEKANHAT